MSKFVLRPQDAIEHANHVPTSTSGDLLQTAAQTSDRGDNAPAAQLGF